MPNEQFKVFSAGSLSKSINLQTPDFMPDLEFSGETYNVTSGIFEGIGPRYGIAPIPGHSDNQTVPATKFPGLLAAENTWFTDYSRTTGGTPVTRQNIYAIIPITLGGADSAAALALKQQYYVFVVGMLSSNYSGSIIIDSLLLSTYPSSVNLIEQSPNIYDGLPPNFLSTGATNASGVFFDMLCNNNAAIALQTIPSGTNFVCAVSASISGPMVSCSWLIGFASGTTATATKAPSLDLNYNATFKNSSTNYWALASFGITSDIVYGNFSLTQRTANVYALDTNGSFNMSYSVTFAPSSAIFVPSYVQDSAVINTNINLSSITATKTAGGTAYTSTLVAIYNDTAMQVNSSYQAVLIAAGKPIVTLYQDWIRDPTGKLNQYVDLTNTGLQPPSIQGVYTEDGNPVSTCWWYTPLFVTGTPMASGGTSRWVLNSQNSGSPNGVGSGILRANTTYEIAFSLYNKRLNYESNVGAPMKFNTGATDYTSLQIFTPAQVSGQTMISSFLAANQIAPVFFPGAVTTSGVRAATAPQVNYEALNHIEYRFYYRQFGTEEFLPALFIDAVDLWFSPANTPVVLCAGAIGGTTGGQPGAFNDYSYLPSDDYFCCLMYKNRAFWMSKSTIYFSNLNNIFAYAGRNQAACPSGSFRGMLVQAYYGQAQQDARLVIFSDSGTYRAYFNGNPQTVAVQVSAASVASFPLDGTDFEIDSWTDMNSFSYRSAVVAEGLLYFWGEQGIFLDDGVDPVTRVSIPLEPYLFTYYDPAQTQNIVACYNSTSKEIYWFYPPKVQDGFATHAVIYNLVHKQWLFAKYDGTVDAAQTLAVTTGIPTSGGRGVLFSRASPSSSVQRAYYWDQQNRAGDIFPGTELMVESFTSPTAQTRALTLAPGYSTANFNTIALGDLICLQQVSQYATTLTQPSDFIATVSALSSGVITITLPPGATLDASATFATNNLYMPIWHKAPTSPGLNGIPWVIDSFYWVPAGMAFWAYWMYVHMVFKLQQVLPAPSTETIAFSYRSPISYSDLTDTLTLVNNSDNNCQINHMLRVGNQNLEGQGMRFNFAGIQIGSQWMLQYLEAFAIYKTGDQLKLFEG